MSISLKNKILGINGSGRIGKLTLWNQLSLKHFDGIVINAGREVGRNIDDIIQYFTVDSTYGQQKTNSSMVILARAVILR